MAQVRSVHEMAAKPATLDRVRAATGFVVAAAAALAVGEFVSALVADWRSPVQAVAETVIDRSPSSVTRFGIDTFGTNDKVALVVGILVIIALMAPLLGVLARTRPWLGRAAFVSFGVIGIAASAQGASISSGMPSAVAAVTGIVAVHHLQQFARDDATAAAQPSATTDGLDRRRFLLGATAFASAAAIAGATGRALQTLFSAAASRSALVLPGARETLPAPPAGASFGIDGVAPLFTPNGSFYRIDTALTVPQVPVEDWTLRVHGMVDTPFVVDFDELAAFGLVEVDITLTCVSNPVGGDLVGNARWLGVPLRALLDEAGVDPDADQIVGRSTDGYTGGFPVEAAYDRDAIVAVGMNGEPLPLQHGFPARLVTPGLYGYVSATKWLTEIELTRFDRFDQYWVPRGYAERAPVKIMTRIDVPRSGEILDTGESVIAGVAWAQTRGISRVEVQIDDQAFADAELADALSDDTWRQWRFPWTATDGNHRIAVRATDSAGQVQTERRTGVLPDGATGWQSRLVTVRST